MSYNEFAYVYDKIINTDYEKWIDYLEKIFKLNNTEPKLVLDLACGTGNITCRLSDKGYDMIGVDNSCDMLSVALQKSFESNKNILFLNQDITDFDLYGSVDAILCMMDGVNYLTDLKKVNKMFERVNYFLNPGGLFIFDFRSEYGLSKIVSNNTFIEDSKDVTYIWQNEYDNERRISNMDLIFFVKEEGSYNKFYESHSLKSYSIGEIKKALENSKLELINVYDDLSFEPPVSQSERIFIVAKKTS